MKAWFRAIAAAFKNNAAAQSAAGLTFLALSLFIGQSLSYSNHIFLTSGRIYNAQASNERYLQVGYRSQCQQSIFLHGCIMTRSS